jgi:hypothetical protein
VIRGLLARLLAWRRHPDLLTDVLRDRIDGVDRHGDTAIAAVHADDFAIWESECAAINRLAKKHARRSR